MIEKRISAVEMPNETVGQTGKDTAPSLPVASLDELKKRIESHLARVAKAGQWIPGKVDLERSNPPRPDIIRREDGDLIHLTTVS